MKSKTYEEFVEKFKPKKTTDDCMTPSLPTRERGLKKKAPPVLPTPARLPGEPGGQYSPRQAILYHLTREKSSPGHFYVQI